jgi:CelD/BcsL family acetyltransferase involved in cellulose biosynthesis
LSQQGNLIFELVTDSARVPAVLDWLFRRKTERLVRTNQQSIWRETEVYKNFLIAVTRTNLFEQIRLFNLTLNGQMVSAVLCRISKYRIELVIAVFEPTFSKYGPGHLVFEEVLKWAFERRLDCDFRLGREAYKKLWTNSTSEAITYSFVNSLRGAAFISAKRFLRLGATAILGRKALKEV